MAGRLKVVGMFFSDAENDYERYFLCDPRFTSLLPFDLSFRKAIGLVHIDPSE